MAIATGVAKRVAFKKESTFGTAAGTSGAKYLRRTQSTLELTKATYESGEIRSDYQVADMRHGARSVTGSIDGELSPGSYSPFIGSALRKDFVTGVNSTALTNVTAAAGTPGTFTRASGSFLTDGFKIGDIVRWTGWTTTGTGNNATNFRISALTAAVMSCVPIGAGAVASKASGDSVTCTVVGKKSFVPQSSHTNDSYTIAHEFADVSEYDHYLGCRVSSLDFNVPSTGMATLSIGFMGQDASLSNGSAYFSSPTAAGTTGVVAGVNGKLNYNGTDIAVVSSLSLKVDGGHSVGTVVGSNLTPDVFVGRVKVSGSFTAYFQDGTFVEDFLNEATPSLSFVLTTDNTATADFVSVVLPKIKLGSATRSDGEQGLTVTASFTALLNSAGGTGIATELTTVSIQDSAAA